MQDRNISTKVLLAETIHLLRYFLVIVVFAALACFIIYLTVGYSKKLLAIVFSTFFSLSFFSAPLASSAARAKRRLRLFTSAGGKTLLFCFFWGSIVVSLAIATLQFWQGMETNFASYAVSMLSAGFICSAIAMLPGSRQH
ncbi:MAG TPA: hypothetical protein VF471_08960 [Pseudoxanthomonas sp.]